MNLLNYNIFPFDYLWLQEQSKNGLQQRAATLEINVMA